MGNQTLTAAFIGVTILALSIMPTCKKHINANENSDASQQVIFKKIGNYIRTAIYVHIHINLPIIPFIKEIEKFLDLFIEQRNIINARLKEQKDKLPTDMFNMEIVQSEIWQLEILRQDVLHEIQILPTHSRDKRQLEVFATFLGVVGTIFGGFNAHQIEKIKATLKIVWTLLKWIQSKSKIWKLVWSSQTLHLKNKLIQIYKMYCERRWKLPRWIR